MINKMVNYQNRTQLKSTTQELTSKSIESVPPTSYILTVMPREFWFVESDDVLRCSYVGDFSRNKIRLFTSLPEQQHNRAEDGKYKQYLVLKTTSTQIIELAKESTAPMWAYWIHMHQDSTGAGLGAYFKRGTSKYTYYPWTGAGTQCDT